MLDLIEQALHVRFTDEQREIIEHDYTESARITACAGAGKTSTAVALLYYMIHYGGKSVNSILCTSFTREATGNLSRKYRALAGSLHSPLEPRFITMDAYCRALIMEHFDVLGFEEAPDITSALDISDHNIRISEVLTELNVPHRQSQAKSMAELVRFLDSAMIFDETTISNLYKFQRTRLSLETVRTVRVYQYQTSIYSNTINLGNLGLYALAILLTKPSIGYHLRKQNDILVIDESQDYSLMKLEIAKQIAEKDKAKFIEESMSVGGSLSLYTIHGAKGLEADVVCVVDAEEEIMPSRVRIERLIQGGYYLEAANQLRDEFNLAYVVATRTKRDLYILFRDELAKVFDGTHNYDVLEKYLTMQFSGDKDVELFAEFVKEANI